MNLQRINRQRVFRPIAILVACFVFGATATAWAASGDLDPSFGGGDGVVSLPRTGPYDDDNFEALAVDGQGRIIAVTSADSALGPTPPILVHVARLEHDGTLSSGFGDNGVATVDLGGGASRVDDVYIKSNGKIVLAGWWEDRNFGNHWIVVQLTADGDLDPSFGNDGALRFSGLGIATGMDNSDRLYVTISKPPVQPGVRPPLLLRRYDPQGQLDPSFSGDGRRNLPFAVAQMAVRGDGKTAFLFTDTDCNCLKVLGLTSSGQIDQNFGTGGIADLVGAPELVGARTAWNKNKLFVWGRKNVGRLLATGGPDLSWSGDGWAAYPTRAGEVNTSHLSLAFALDGIYVPGSSSITRLHHNGTIDRTFGSNGFATPSVPAGFGAELFIAGLPGELVSGGYISVPGDTCTCQPWVTRRLTQD